MQFVVIVTFGRTGSTALQHALNHAPGVLVRGENFNALKGLHECYRSLSKAFRAFGSRALPPRDPWYGADLWDEPAFLAGQRELVVSQILKPLPETRILGFKEIRHLPPEIPTFDELLDYLCYLDRLLPGVKFIVNLRDPAAAARSGWWPAAPDGPCRVRTVSGWLGRIPRALRDRLGREGVITTRYEEWSSCPAVLEPVWDFIGAPWDPVAVKAALQTRLTH